MNSRGAAKKPRIRIIHHMARTGGTLICRCLASMKDVVLLSEIHPAGMKMFNPLQQAHDWYGLLEPEDEARARRGEFGFLEAIQLISRRCEVANLTLLLRDWSHLDYTGVPYASPSFRSTLADALTGEFEVVRFSTVRHPLDQWLSLSQNSVYREQLGAVKFLRGVRRFAESAVETGFVRYEDFARDPDRGLRDICAALQLEFDPGYATRWMYHVNITGDVLPGRAGERIAVLQRQTVDAKEEARFRSLANYTETVALLGYAQQ